MTTTSKKAFTSHEQHANNLVSAFTSHVFLKAAKCFPFSHRSTESLRHPSSSLAKLCRAAEPEASGDPEDYCTCWNRVAVAFETKTHSDLIAQCRTNLLLNELILTTLEKAWSSVPRNANDLIMFPEYKWIEDSLWKSVGLDSTGLFDRVLLEDFTYDCHGLEGVSFASFCLSMLEVADTWTPSRKSSDYAAFLEKSVLTPLKAAQRVTKGVATTPNEMTFVPGPISKKKIVQRQVLKDGTEHFFTI